MPRWRFASASAPCNLFSIVFFVCTIFTIVISVFSIRGVCWMLVCAWGFLAWAGGYYWVFVFLHLVRTSFYGRMLGTCLCFVISKTCYPARCLRAWVICNVVVTFWMWGGAWQWCRLSISLLSIHCCAFSICVCLCVCSECLRCAACRASLSPLVFMGLDVDYWLQLWRFFCWQVFVCWATCAILLHAFKSLVGKFGFGFVTSSKAVHNVVLLLVRLYKFFRWSPGWRFTAGFK